MAKFSMPISDLIGNVQEDVEQTVRKAALGVFSDVIKRSPVDTGRFRANWRFAEGEADTGTTDSTDAGLAQAAANTALTAQIGTVWNFTNSLPYAERLEFGHSKQAPSGMVRLAIKSWAAQVQKAIKK